MRINSWLFLSLFLILSLFTACSFEDKKELSKDEAEKIALQTFLENIEEYNDKNGTNLAPKDVIVKSNETKLDTDKSVWVVYLTEEDEHSPINIAVYQIDLDGEVISYAN